MFLLVERTTCQSSEILGKNFVHGPEASLTLRHPSDRKQMGLADCAIPKQGLPVAACPSLKLCASCRKERGNFAVAECLWLKFYNLRALFGSTYTEILQSAMSKDSWLKVFLTITSFLMLVLLNGGMFVKHLKTCLQQNEPCARICLFLTVSNEITF